MTRTHTIDLADLAVRIRTEHEASVTMAKASLAHAVEAGRLLVDAKAQLPHGRWLPWLAEHVDISQRTAQQYMGLAKANAHDGAHLGETISAARVRIATPRTPARDEATAAAEKALANAFGAPKAAKRRRTGEPTGRTAKGAAIVAIHAARHAIETCDDVDPAVVAAMRELGEAIAAATGGHYADAA